MKQPTKGSLRIKIKELEEQAFLVDENHRISIAVDRQQLFNLSERVLSLEAEIKGKNKQNLELASLLNEKDTELDSTAYIIEARNETIDDLSTEVAKFSKPWYKKLAELFG